MSDFRKLRMKAFPEIQMRETSEAKYWKSYGTTFDEKLIGAPRCIHFNPASNDSYIVTAGPKVSLFESATDKLQRSYTRFSDDAFSGQFRRDGKLIVAGDKGGEVKVFDVPSKAQLRQLKGHTSAVKATVWSSDGLGIISGSDDKSIRTWDLGTGTCTWSNTTAHSDYVKCLYANPSTPHTWVSGSYDHTVKLWDSRQKNSVLTLTHSQPVEDCIVPSSGAMLLAASGPEVKVWDIISGGKLLHTFNNHQKNVSALALESSGSRFISAGLDGQLKVYSLKTMQVAHGMKMGAPLLSVAISADNKKLAVGFVDGQFQVRSKRAGGASAPPGSTGAGAGAGADDSGLGEVDGDVDREESKSKRFYKGAGAAVESTADRMVESERRVRLKPYEVHLKDFSYQKALDAALASHNPLAVVTVLEELCRRSGLTIALQGRDERTLEPLLSFCARYVAHPRYSSLVLSVTHRLVDIYAGVLGHSDAIDELFLKLHRQVRAEVGMQRKMMSVMGALDGIISSSVIATTTSTTSTGGL